jgi:hypothetical protein
MEQPLEYIAFGAIPFAIDRKRREFRQVNRPDNIISFEDLKKEEGYYLARFEKNANYLSIARLTSGSNNNDTLDVSLPAPVIDSPELLTADFKADLNTLSNHKGWAFFLADEDTALRLSGKLPHIDLAGTDYTIDWRLRELRETEQPWNNISLKDLEMSDSGEEYLCFFNTETHELFEPDGNLLAMPVNVVVLEIPYEIKLDPVAVAREYGIGETDLLIDHPFQMQSSAKVTPLSETGLSKFIENNIERQKEQQHNRTAKRGR